MYFIKEGNMKKNRAFTLAEVLVTVGIIGVVAAMTLPSVITNYQKKQTVAKLKKVYTTLMQATEFAKREYGDIKDWDFSLDGNDFLQRYYAPYLKTASNKKQYKYVYTDLAGKQRAWTKDSLFLQDGTAIFVVFYRALDVKFHFVIDINGMQKPNKVGRDIFAFTIHNNMLGTYTQYSKLIFKRYVALGTGTSGQCNKKASGGIIGAGSYCSSVIEMDNWEIADDYPWF